MTDSKPLPPVGIVKPTMETRFFVDQEWWQKNSQDLNQALISICAELEYELVETDDTDIVYDWINPDTGQVSQVTEFHYLFLVNCAGEENFLTERLSLVESLFRALMGSGNKPMNPIELAEATGRPATKILQTLSGRRTYKGIRPA